MLRVLEKIFFSFRAENIFYPGGGKQEGFFGGEFCVEVWGFGKIFFFFCYLLLGLGDRRGGWLGDLKFLNFCFFV